ncbi:hypothetical protein SLA2020_368610 [Shorea laevis]
MKTPLQTEAAKAVLGNYYREPKKSGPIPFYLLNTLLRSFKEDHFVSDIGDIVYYETDKDLYKFYKSTKSAWLVQTSEQNCSILTCFRVKLKHVRNLLVLLYVV